MKPYQIKIKTADGTRQMVGIFSHSIDAINAGIDAAGGQPCSVSAKVAA